MSLLPIYSRDTGAAQRAHENMFRRLLRVKKDPAEV
jgi:hypothetical protein